MPTTISQIFITPINNTVGIFFHEEDTIRVSNNKWTLLVYKELEPIKQSISNNDKILSNLIDTFDQSNPRMISFKPTIQTHVNLLTQIADSVNLKFKEITTETKKYELRARRGLINGIGSIFKSITGNLDSSDGDYYNECINKINRDEREIENLLKSQISVTTSVISNFNSTIRKLQIDEESFNENIAEIQTSMSNLSDDFAFYESQIKALDICQSLMESYVFLEDSLNDILNAITFARLRILHSSIITPRDLVLSLQDISKSLSKNNLPLPTYSSNIGQYLDIIELEAYQTENKIVFVLKIPLIEPETYTLFKIFPIPLLDNRTGIYHILSTSIKFIARDDNSLLYILPEDLETCKQLQPNVKICSDLLQFPIDSDAICEAQLLRQTNKLPRTCPTSLLLATDYNVREIEQNYWLISISDPIPITIKCENREMITYMLRTNYLLRLQPNCNAFIGSTRIHSKHPIQKYRNVTYRSHPVKIPFDCCTHLPDKFHIPELKPIKLSNLDMDDLNIAQHRLNQYSEELDKMTKQPFVSRHLHWLTIFTIVLIIVLVLFYICCKCRQRRRTPTLSLTDGNDPPPPEPQVHRLQQRFRKILPRRRSSIHPEEPIEEEAFELRCPSNHP